MKKLFTIITLLMSSFFLFSINEVSADTIDYVITDTDMSYLSDTFYSYREKVVNYCNENNMHYYIITTGSDTFRAYVSADKPYTKLVYGSLYITSANAATCSVSSSSDFSCSGSSSPSSNIVYNNQMLFDRFLDSSSTELLNLLSNSYNIIYNDKSYLFESQGTMLPLYQLIEEFNKPEEPADPFIEDKEMMNNFYSTIFTKIGDLATSFASNYIFLLIFGIFILIFVFELIRRRLL